MFEKLAPEHISGVTFSGGDPLHPENRAEVTRLAGKCRERFPDKTIWLYTGYKYEEIAELEIMKYCYVLVDGEFVKAQFDEKLHWRGSSNQRVIDVRETARLKKIVLFD